MPVGNASSAPNESSQRPLATGIPSPWLTIWRQPRATIQHVVDTQPERHVVALGALSGIADLLSRAIDKNLGDRSSLLSILTLVLLAGPIWGVLRLYLGSVLLCWTGRWLGGHASTVALRAACAWGAVPMLAGMSLLLPMLLTLGGQLFMAESPWLDQHPFVAIGVFLPAGVSIIAGVAWTAVITCKMIGQVQGFSAWRAVVNVLAATVLGLVPFVIAAALVVGVLKW